MNHITTNTIWFVLIKFHSWLTAFYSISKNKTNFSDFPGGAVVKNPPANAGDRGSSPGPGISHMLQSN